jgi:pSer/pThr/pTyr-binding forkhead associated (FHA) protein
MPNLLKVRLSLKGRPLQSYTFNKTRVTIGRDPGSDIFLDNTGISRHHAVIERTAGGYVIEDLGSANGTFLNDQPVRKEYLGQDDVLQIGKFALWMGVESDRRERALSGRGDQSMMEGTMVIDPDSLLQMQKKSRTDAPVVEEASPSRSAAGLFTCPVPLAVGFVAGVVVGCVATLILGG